MLGGDFFLSCVLHDGEAFVELAHVYLAQTLVEHDLCRVELELEAELLVIDVLVTTEIEEGTVKVPEGEVVPLEEEVGDPALEVGDGEELVELGRCEELLYGGFVLADGGVDETHVGEDLGRVCDGGEELEGLFKVLFVVCLEGCGPCFELGFERHDLEREWLRGAFRGGRVSMGCSSVPDAIEKGLEQAPGLEEDEGRRRQRPRKRREGGGPARTWRPAER